MRRPTRILLVVVGLLPVTDGALTLCHERLKPREEEPREERHETRAEGEEGASRLEPGLIEREVYRAPPVPLILCGLALVAIGAWPRRRRPAPGPLGDVDGDDQRGYRGSTVLGVRRPLRIALAVVGLAVVVYGTASLTGEWLGTPPWWYVKGHSGSVPGMTTSTRWTVYARRPGREWISGGVVAVGLGLVAVGAWPRRLSGATS